MAKKTILRVTIRAAGTEPQGGRPMNINGIEIPDKIEQEVKAWALRQSSFTTPQVIRVLQSIFARFPAIRVKHASAGNWAPGVHLDRVADRYFRVWKADGLIKYSNNTKRWSVLANTTKEIP